MNSDRPALHYKILLLLFAVSVILCGCGVPQAELHFADDVGYIPCAAVQPELELMSQQAFIYDTDSGEFIYRKGEERVIYPASTVKLLTILYALELISPDENVTPGNELALVQKDSSVAYIKTYHTLTVEMLIEGMLLPSGNDAAYALAAAAGRKLTDAKSVDGKTAVELFMDGMNAYAARIGMCGSHFDTPDGYYSKSTYTTIEDIALVSVLASQNSIISKYAALNSDTVTYTSGHVNTWVNTNLLLDKSSKYYSPYAGGLKTGSAGRGNYSLISTVDIGGHSYIIGIFSSENKTDRYDDTLSIISYLEGK